MSIIPTKKQKFKFLKDYYYNRKSIFFVIFCIGILQIFDIISTLLFLSKGIEEGNYLFATLFNHGLYFHAIFFKLILTGLTCYLLYIYDTAVIHSQNNISINFEFPVKTISDYTYYANIFLSDMFIKFTFYMYCIVVLVNLSSLFSWGF